MSRLALLLLLALGCDTIVDVDNLPPELDGEGVGWCDAEGRRFISVTLVDRESDAVSLQLTHGGEPVAVGAEGDGITGLRTSPEGVSHLIEWAQPCSDADCYTPSCLTSGACVPPPAGAANLRLSIVDTDPLVAASVDLGDVAPCTRP